MKHILTLTVILLELQSWSEQKVHRLAPVGGGLAPTAAAWLWLGTIHQIYEDLHLYWPNSCCNHYWGRIIIHHLRLCLTFSRSFVHGAMPYGRNSKLLLLLSNTTLVQYCHLLMWRNHLCILFHQVMAAKHTGPDGSDRSVFYLLCTSCSATWHFV